MTTNVTDEANDTAWPPSPTGSELPADDGRVPLHKRKGLRQFVKFCIVGASSAAVNFGLMNLLHYRLELPLISSLTIAFLLSVFNGFYWNRKWTFAHARGRSAANQYTKFLAVNIVGYILNTSITVAIIAALVVAHSHGAVDFGAIFMDVITGKKATYPKLVTNGALLGATGVVVFWNFFANRHWTFKH
ncbi:MAG TPA: GtrA family protein [Capsulimonadaceae bacterium]